MKAAEHWSSKTRVAQPRFRPDSLTLALENFGNHTNSLVNPMTAKCQSPLTVKQAQSITSPPRCLTVGVRVLVLACYVWFSLHLYFMFQGRFAESLVLHSDATLQTQVIQPFCFWREPYSLQSKQHMISGVFCTV